LLAEGFKIPDGYPYCRGLPNAVIVEPDTCKAVDEAEVIATTATTFERWGVSTPYNHNAWRPVGPCITRPAAPVLFAELPDEVKGGNTGCWGREKEISAPAKKCFGDGVYAAFDGYHIALTTENGVGTDYTIYMEAGVIAKLEAHIAKDRDYEDDEHAEPNPAFIVRAVNSHADMLEALKLTEKNVAGQIDRLPVDAPLIESAVYFKWLVVIRAAISKAEVTK